MKNNTKTAMALAFCAALFACNKDQSCINKMEGNWVNLDTEMWINDVAVADSIANNGTISIYNFSPYKVKDATQGQLILTTIPVSGTATVDTFDYSIHEHCTKFTWGSTTADILSIDAQTLTFEWLQDSLKTRVTLIVEV